MLTLWNPRCRSNDNWGITMQFKIKRLSALIALALVAGSANAGNLCSDPRYANTPGMGCGNTSGMTDSTQHGWVGAQGNVGATPWMPPQTDTLTQALQAASNGQLPVYPGYNGYAVPAGYEALVSIPTPQNLPYPYTFGTCNPIFTTLFYNGSSYIVGATTSTLGCGGG